MGNQLAPVIRCEWVRRSTTGVVKTASGVLHTYYVNAATTGIVTLSDNIGNFLVIPTSLVAGTYVADLDIGFVGPLTATFGAAGDITFAIR